MLKTIALWNFSRDYKLTISSASAYYLRLLLFQLSAEIILRSALWYECVKRRSKLTFTASGLSPELTLKMTSTKTKRTTIPNATVLCPLTTLQLSLGRQRVFKRTLRPSKTFVFAVRNAKAISYGFINGNHLLRVTEPEKQVSFR